MERPRFRMPLAPYSGYVTLAFLAGVLVLMIFDQERGPWIIATLVLGIPALIGGWFLVRNRVTAAAQEGAVHSADAAVTADVPIENVPVVGPIVADKASEPDD
jgi:L-asparagine permease